MKSTQKDQPAHVAGEPVDLACLNIAASLSQGTLEVTLTEMALRRCTMDEYGVGYTFQMPKTEAAKAWVDAGLSRLNFGLDNFSVDVNVHQCYLVRRDPSKVTKDPRSDFNLTMDLSARVWCWKSDTDLAVGAMKKAVAETLDRLSGQGLTMGLEVSMAELQPGKVPPSPKLR